MTYIVKEDVCGYIWGYLKNDKIYTYTDDELFEARKVTLGWKSNFREVSRRRERYGGGHRWW